jgi:hypothetical protein
VAGQGLGDSHEGKAGTTALFQALTAATRLKLVPLIPRISIEAVEFDWDHADPRIG